MDFDEIFKQGHKNQRYGHDKEYRYDDNYRSSHSHNKQGDMKFQILERLQNNPKLKSLLIIAVIVVLILIVMVIVLFLPLLLKLFSFISENGIQGLIDAVWKGSK